MAAVDNVSVSVDLSPRPLPRFPSVAFKAYIRDNWEYLANLGQRLYQTMHYGFKFENFCHGN